LSGIVPVGAFLVEHFVSNAFATNGPTAYALQVKFLSGLPFREWLEWFGIFLPLAFHAGYGFYIWWRGDSNVAEYPWTGNWAYTAQRYTGIIAFFYIVYHVWYMRYTGVSLPEHPGAAFGKVQGEFFSAWWPPLVYLVGIITASWHFGYGLFLFAAKWGLVTGDKARRRMQFAGIGVALLFMVVGVATMRSFWHYDRQPTDPAGALQIEKGTQPIPEK
jgi:succinate dehydrogenase / fumarate reductase cytochrome b subunit